MDEILKSYPLTVQQDAYQTALELATDVFNPQLNIKILVGFKGIYLAAQAKLLEGQFKE